MSPTNKPPVDFRKLRKIRHDDGLYLHRNDLLEILNEYIKSQQVWPAKVEALQKFRDLMAERT